MNPGFSSHWFLAAGGYSHFHSSTMFLLSYATASYSSNTLIGADAYVPIKSIVLILRQFFIFKIQ